MKALLTKALLTSTILVGACNTAEQPVHEPLRGVAPTVLWAWHGEQDLSAIDPAEVSVAYLARTLHVSSSGVSAEPRREELRVPEGTTMIGVVRIEPDPYVRGSHLDARSAEIIEHVLIVAAEPNVRGVQLDFDAGPSLRAAYLALLTELRGRLPDHFLSMTALASWCFDDRWLGDAPVDAVVPMMFAMGPAAPELLDRLDHAPFPEPACRTHIGWSTEEPTVARHFAHRWVFTRGTWTESRLAHLP